MELDEKIGTEGSTQTRNRASRIDQLLAFSRDVFSEEGYAAFSARRVAAKAGTTLSTVQYYFPSREDLLRETVESFLEAYLHAYSSIAEGHGLPQRKLNDLLQKIFDDVNEPNVPRLMFEAWAVAQHEPEVLEIVERTYAHYRLILARLILEINPALSQEESIVRATLVASQTEGLMIFAFRGGDTEKDNLEVARTMKRSARYLASLPPQIHDEFEDGVPEASHSDLSTAGQAPLTLSFPQSTESATAHRRPTMQSIRRAEKVREIIRIAAGLLSTEGYANFTQGRVAKLAGILTSNLQHYFKTHDELLHATLHALMSTYLVRYSAISVASNKSPVTRMDEITTDLVSEIKNPNVVSFSLEMFALAQRNEVANELLIRVYRAYREIFVSLVHELDPAASSKECYARATLIAATLEGLMLYRRSLAGAPGRFAAVNRVLTSLAVLIGQGLPQDSAS
ncbi:MULTISPECIES: TetR/AcrR family transcriptional regulator [Caballeronia]|uniref:TetR/AcrR family transcriptional regulator n=1 Tax=Caballeronia TaxID=1827195 RepID=UPI001FD07373|nr:MULTISPECIES: TetR/AcrR family transcriptional regulator [Caballeronia]MDR5799152.1 TetR/AcrR family transcriptional regulator [Caballeronia sp. LZ001]